MIGLIFVIAGLSIFTYTQWRWRQQGAGRRGAPWWVAPASLAIASLVALTLGSLEILHGSWLDRSNGSWPAWFFRVVLYSLLALAVCLFLRLGMLEREIKRDQQVIIRAIQRAKEIREEARKRRLKVFNDEREKVKKY